MPLPCQPSSLARGKNHLLLKNTNHSSIEWVWFLTITLTFDLCIGSKFEKDEVTKETALYGWQGEVYSSLLVLSTPLGRAYS